jgi:hypothetical protein
MSGCQQLIWLRHMVTLVGHMASITDLHHDAEVDERAVRVCKHGKCNEETSVYNDCS